MKGKVYLGLLATCLLHFTFIPDVEELFLMGQGAAPDGFYVFLNFLLKIMNVTAGRILTFEGKFKVNDEEMTAVSEQMVKQMKEMHKKTCLGRSGVSKDGLAKFMAEGELDDPAFKKYCVCMFKQFQSIKNGQVAFKEVSNQAKTMLPQSIGGPVLEALSKCSNEGGDALEDRIYNFVKCSHKTNVKSILII